MIKVQLQYSPNNKAKFSLLLDTELDLTQGVIAVFGESGGGKSSFLKCLAGLLPYQGHIEFNTLPTEINSKHTEPTTNPCVYQPQQGGLFPTMSVEDNLLFVLRHSEWRHHNPFSLEQVVHWCELTPLLSHNIGHLSGGEKQRVSFARSLLAGKPIVLLDEPFSALDWQSRQKMLTLVTRLNNEFNMLFVIVSHSLREVALCSRYIFHLQQGQITQHGQTKTLIDTLALSPGQQIFSSLRLQLESIDSEHQLTRWQLPNKQFIYSRGIADSTTIGHSSVHTLDADKVSLNRKLEQDSSILNHVEGQIVTLTSNAQQTLVTLDVGGQILFAEISQLSYRRLNLQLGETVFAQFKAL